MCVRCALQIHNMIVYKHTNSCKLQLGDQTFFSVELQADSQQHRQQHQPPRKLEWNETFAFLAGGNVGASEVLELQLKQTVRDPLDVDCFGRSCSGYDCDNTLLSYIHPKTAAAHLPDDGDDQDPARGRHRHRRRHGHHDLEPRAGQPAGMDGKRVDQAH